MLCTFVMLLLAFMSTCQEVEEESCPSQASSSETTSLEEALITEEKSCLLAHRVSFAKVLSFSAQGDVHRAWRQEQFQLEREMNESQSILDRFIEEQATSSSACSARLMESKRTLDGLLQDVKQVSVEIASHVTILETEMENLNITHMSIEAVETEMKQAFERCKKERADALKEVKQYSSELDELIQIAKPGVRYQHSMKIANRSMDKLWKEAMLSNSTILIEKSDWKRDQCSAFINFARRHNYRLWTNMSKTQAPDKRACDEQREELQEAYTKSYLEVKNLLKEAKDRTVDESCFESASAKKAAEMVPLAAQRDQSSGRIEYSAAAVAATEPVLALVDDRAERLREHIKEKLTPACKEAGLVTEVLQKVRELIISLSECPGHGDFRLQIPTGHEGETKEAPNLECAQHEPGSRMERLCKVKERSSKRIVSRKRASKERRASRKLRMK
eukprot:gnl/MRDRNA2_/MRDRNA2_116827_c0_seq1.p1 gnl/MRDRNA2_/MRDRNA2_116827_c0~~gnl/MRDRNA2_/MRDRNA2_116827_c0_seq1.p1  ORF type:complete len:448 (+),score=111.37 gnl/MRDRNA2_/MRDRNA2_116827_c0_seq1:96-1439(+)